MYVDKRLSEMKDRASPIFTMVGMALRIGILVLVLCCGKWACDKAVNTAHYSVSDYELKQYYKSETRDLLNLRKQRLISKEELLKRAKELETNTKEFYIRDNR